MRYNPQPVDIDDITLAPEQLALAELVAQAVHSLWSNDQFHQGWRHGSVYDSAARTHPDLVPYAQLDERSQQRQRDAVLTAFKVLLALGYRIDRGSSTIAPASVHPGSTHPAPPHSTTTQDEALAESPEVALALSRLKASSEVNLATLITLRQQTIKLSPQTPPIYRALGEASLKIGEPLMAYDVLGEGLKQWPNDLRLQQLLALALARSGSTDAANSLLTTLVQAGHQDEETIGLLARTHKDLWTQASTPAVAERQLSLAAQRYQQAYDLTGSIWVGINAATMAALMNQSERAQQLAQAIKDTCLAQLATLAQTGGDPYWLLATLGEAALILRDLTAAEEFYGQAIAQGQGRFGDFSSSRRNALLLGQHLGIDLARIKRWFHVPRVVMFCGHRIDQPNRRQPRFPPELAPKVYDAIRDRLQRLDAHFGYASAACGADILFLEALQSLQGELHIVLPYGPEACLRDAVYRQPDGQWEKRFEQVMSKASEVVVASQRSAQQSPTLYDYSNRLLHGLAKIRATQLGSDLIPLAVWDGQPGRSEGTASTVNLWQQWNETVEVIDLAALLNPQPVCLPSQAAPAPTKPAPATPDSTTPDPATPDPATVNTEPTDPVLRALLFADVVNYTHLSEEQFLPFADYFLGAVAQLLDTPGYQPLTRNTWGDALYLVFATVEQAGQAALDLCDLVQRADWGSKGLPADLNLRIALHAGPVSCRADPLTGQVSYVGTHVNHTARIEPITPPGKVYASQAFAAIAASAGQAAFRCDYVGQMPWAKHYGTFPTYSVRRAWGRPGASLG